MSPSTATRRATSFPWDPIDPLPVTVVPSSRQVARDGRGLACNQVRGHPWSIQRRGRRIYTANATPPAPLAATPGTRQPESRGGPGTRHFGPTGAAIRLRPETALGGGDAIRATEPTFSRRRSPIT